MICFDMDNDVVDSVSNTGIDTDNKIDNVIFTDGRMFVLPDSRPYFYEIELSGKILKKYQTPFFPKGVRNVFSLGKELWVGGRSKALFNLSDDNQSMIDLSIAFPHCIENEIKKPLMYMCKMVGSFVWIIPYYNPYILCVKKMAI